LGTNRLTLGSASKGRKGGSRKPQKSLIICGKLKP
jgi:hypothetical protein